MYANTFNPFPILILFSDPFYNIKPKASPCFCSLVIMLIQCLSYSIIIKFLSRTLLCLRILWGLAEFWNILSCCLPYATITFNFSERRISINFPY